MSIAEALRGAQVELAQTNGLGDKLRLCSTYARILGGELLGTIRVAPYGYKAWRLHSRLSEPTEFSDVGEQKKIGISRDQRYGQRARNVMDIYLPSSAMQQKSREYSSGCPVAVFCHGGVWATGAKWHYSPLASRLAEEGIMTCVLQYTLYPQALVPQMVGEVSSALSWAQDHITRFGGSPDRITLVGHSAGAQLCMMALLHRAAGTCPTGRLAADVRMPARFVGMAGAYDIARHFQYEKERGVVFLSTMARAMGGEPAFASQSPAFIVEGVAGSFSGRPAQAIAVSSHLSGMEVAAEADMAGSGILGGSVCTGPRQLANAASKAAIVTRPEHGIYCCGLTATQMQALPPINLMSSREDITVPWYQSAIMHKALQRCGCNASHHLYKGVDHAGFAIDWTAKASHKALPRFASDLVTLSHTQ